MMIIDIHTYIANTWAGKENAMTYIPPETVLSPKGRVDDIDVIYDKGPSTASWSIAKLKWNKVEAIGIRWNGDEDHLVGTPQSRGKATWFIVPEEIAEAVLSAATNLSQRKSDSLLAGYREMAADREREAEAEAWSEALIGDGLEAR
jgi:hypothetical protein